MRIGLDTTRVATAGGERRYTLELISALCREFPGHQFVAFGPRPGGVTSRNLQHVPCPPVDGVHARLAYALRIGSLARKHRVDVFHNLCNYGFYRAPCPVVTTVHDLLTIRFPELRPTRLQWVLYRYYVPSLLRRANWIVVDSLNTRRDLETLYGITRNVVTVPLGYDGRSFHPDARGDGAVLRRYGLEPGYLIFAGILEPKKNLGVILEALSELRMRSIRVVLALAGRRGHRARGLFERARSLGIAEQVRELGFVPDGDLPALYRQASVLVFPSRYEGFGLPVVEAMACATPVLASRAGSLPELVGTEQYLCDADAVSQWVSMIEMIVCDHESRAAARTWCLRRAQRFTWEACARAVMAVYEQAGKEQAHQTPRVPSAGGAS